MQSWSQRHAARHVARKVKHYSAKHVMPVNRPTEAWATRNIDKWIEAKPLREARSQPFDWNAWLAQRKSIKH